MRHLDPGEQEQEGRDHTGLRRQRGAAGEHCLTVCDERDADGVQADGEDDHAWRGEERKVLALGAA